MDNKKVLKSKKRVVVRDNFGRVTTITLAQAQKHDPDGTKFEILKTLPPKESK